MFHPNIFEKKAKKILLIFKGLIEFSVDKKIGLNRPFLRFLSFSSNDFATHLNLAYRKVGENPMKQISNLTLD